jgi:DNA-binding YbaB/EbfC family protein
MGDLFKLLGQAGKIKEEMSKVRDRAAAQTVEGEAGGGLVKATANGVGELLSVTIDPEVLKDPETLSPLVAAAANVALRKSRELLMEESQKAAQELGINLPPEMFGG